MEQQMQTIAQWIEDGMPPLKDVVREQAEDVPFKSGLPAANDGAKFERIPALDKRIARGDPTNSNAWVEVASGDTRFYCTGYDANARRTLHIDDVAGRARIDGAAA
jgi:hypothetical protein